MKYVRIAIIKLSTDTTKEAYALIDHFVLRCKAEDQSKDNCIIYLEFSFERCLFLTDYSVTCVINR